jgi:hypothetical protein
MPCGLAAQELEALLQVTTGVPIEKTADCTLNTTIVTEVEHIGQLPGWPFLNNPHPLPLLVLLSRLYGFGLSLLSSLSFFFLFFSSLLDPCNGFL